MSGTRKVVVASRNAHKVKEIAVLMEGLGLELVTIDEVAPEAELIEDEDTFVGNALAKARQAAAATGLPAIADDSGLEVDALDGAPGVYSARYAGVPCNDANNNEKLRLAMVDVPEPRRTARYRCVAAWLDPERGEQITCDGACEGVILKTPQGTGGFGYDPYFFLPELGKAMAEIDADTKNSLSHRGAAFRALGEALRDKQNT